MDSIFFMWSCIAIIAYKCVSRSNEYYKDKITYGKVVCM